MKTDTVHWFACRMCRALVKDGSGPRDRYRGFRQGPIRAKELERALCRRCQHKVRPMM